MIVYIDTLPWDNNMHPVVKQLMLYRLEYISFDLNVLQIEWYTS